MKLRQKSKRDQAVDAVASVAKTWSEWHLAKRASKSVAQGAKKASSLKRFAKSTPVQIAGAIALLGGVGAAVAKKLTGGHAEPLYTPPGRAADMEPPPPSPVVVEDLSGDTPAARETGLGTPPAPAVDVPSPPPTPVVVEDLSGDTPAEPEAGAATEPPADDAVASDATAEPEPDAEPAPDSADEPADRPAY